MNAQPKDFKQFMDALRADVRLGPLMPPPHSGENPNGVIIALAMALSAAVDRRSVHPAHALLAELEEQQGTEAPPLPK